MTDLREPLRPAVLEDGFTMILALGVMFVTSLLLVAAFTIANGEIASSHNDTARKQAYYAAVAGIQEYEYKLQAEPDYWETCAKIESGAPESGVAKSQWVEHYVVTPVVAQSAPEGTKECSTSSPFTSMIQSKGSSANTFRVKSVGEVKVNAKQTAKRELIATFGVSNFLDYVYYTNFETQDPVLYQEESAQALYEAGDRCKEGKKCSTAAELVKECSEKYYSEWGEKNKATCPQIWFRGGDDIKGPMHTNDASAMEARRTSDAKGTNRPMRSKCTAATTGRRRAAPAKAAPPTRPPPVAGQKSRWSNSSTRRRTTKASPTTSSPKTSSLARPGSNSKAPRSS